MWNALLAVSVALASSVSPAAGRTDARAITVVQGEDAAWPAATHELAVLGGYAVGQVIDPQRTDTSFATAMMRWAVHFPPSGSGWRRGNFAIAFELAALTIDQDPRAWGGGANVLIRYAFAGRRWRPMIFGGAGILFTDHDVPPNESDSNFTPQAGLAIQYMLRRRLGLDLEYRFHHISNKGRTETNPGINSHLILLGVSWYR